jgi:hypothetical protein
MQLARRCGVLATMLTLTACTSAPSMPVAEHVDLERFMGDWYVIANIPTRWEVGAHNAVESYRLDRDGSIATTFTYRDCGFDGPEKHAAARLRTRPGVERGLGHAVRLADQGRVPDRPRRRGLHRNDHRAQPS